MPKKSRGLAYPGQDRFKEIVSASFRWLEEQLSFHVQEANENEVQYIGHYCRVVIAWERGDLFVEVVTAEVEPISRLKFSLSELILAKGVASSASVYEYVDRSRSLAARLKSAGDLLAKYGKEFLVGDFSLRPQVVRSQVTAWLADKYDDVMMKQRYASLELGCKQVAWELGKQSRERRSEFQQVLSDWISEDGPKGAFAAKLIEYV